MNKLTLFPDGLKELIGGSSVAMLRGRMTAQRGTATYAVGVTITATVTAAQAVGAWSETLRDTFLKKLTATLTLCASLGLKPNLSKASLFDVRDDCIRILGLDMEGYADTTTGLAQPWTTGANPVSFTVYVPLSGAQAVEGWKDFCGLSPAQVADSEVEIAATTDPFKETSADLTMANVKVQFFPVFEAVTGVHQGPLVFVELNTNAGSAEISTPGGLVLAAEQMGASSSGSTLPPLTVRRGELVEAKDKTPAQIAAAFERGLFVESLEDLIGTHRATVSVLPNQPLGAVVVGRVQADQGTKVVDWGLRSTRLGLLTLAQVKQLVRLEGAGLRDGVQVLAVSNAHTMGLAVEDLHLPYCGFTVFTSDEPDFAKYAGLRYAPGGEVEVWIPPHRLEVHAREVMLALKSSADFPHGDERLVRSLFQKVAREVPGAITNDREGFALSGWVVSEVERKIRQRVAELEQAETLGRAALAKAGVKLA